MDKEFRLPALLIAIPALLLPLWYYVNTDTVGSLWYGEKLSHCNIIACTSTRQVFFPVSLLLLGAIVIGIILLTIKLTLRGKKHAKN